MLKQLSIANLIGTLNLILSKAYLYLLYLDKNMLNVFINVTSNLNITQFHVKQYLHLNIFMKLPITLPHRYLFFLNTICHCNSILFSIITYYMFKNTLNLQIYSYRLQF